jgi:hypothetical protein
MAKITTGKLSVSLIILIGLISLGPFGSAGLAAASLQPVAGSSLIEQSGDLDGQDIIFQGEVIGDVMPRQDHFWINVLDGGVAMGIWITAEQRRLIDSVGRYEIKGDAVRIVGRFNRACPEHGGDMDIHAVSLEVITRGYAQRQPLRVDRLIWAGLLLLPAVLSLTVLIRRFRFRLKTGQLDVAKR